MRYVISVDGHAGSDFLGTLCFDSDFAYIYPKGDDLKGLATEHAQELHRHVGQKYETTMK